MIAVRIGSGKGMSDNDTIILLSGKEVRDLRSLKISSGLYTDSPYDSLGEASLLLYKKLMPTAPCAKSEDYRNFRINPKLYEILEIKRRARTRYETCHGNVIDIVNYSDCRLNYNEGVLLEGFKRKGLIS